MFLSRYQDRPSTLKVDHEIVNGERKGKVHSLNDFDITVWEDGEVTARRKYYATSDPGKHFPNMSVSDGAITLPPWSTRCRSSTLHPVSTMATAANF
jgi:hypothetical protein